jgi:predicted house-cleaning noncanonical NTP pyrophosphatase (MazG superfamily)
MNAERPYIVKLVRDKIGDLLAGDNRVEYKPLPDGPGSDRHVELLRQKLVEEALEYAFSPSAKELSDVLEVVLALARVDLKIPREGLEAARVDKHVDRGGFDEAIAMYVTTTAPVDGDD